MKEDVARMFRGNPRNLSRIISKHSLLEEMDKNKAPMGARCPLFANYSAVHDEVIEFNRFYRSYRFPFSHRLTQERARMDPERIEIDNL